MPQAARLYDPIGHSPTMNWLLRGAVIGAAIGLAAVAIVGTGGLAAVAVVGGLAAGGAGIGDMLSTMSWAAKEVTGKIVGLCSGNVFTNGKRAARAHVDMAECTKHPPVPLPIATGSGNVYINGQPAARVGDTIACSAVITDGSPDVYIGGGSQRTDTISPENLVPPLVHTAMLVVGIGAAVVLAGPIVAVAGLALGAAGGALGGWAGGTVFGEGSDGQKWSMLGGGLIGGLVGSKGGSVLAGKFIPKPTTPAGGFVKSGMPGMKEAAGNQAAAARAAAQDRPDASLGANRSPVSPDFIATSKGDVGGVAGLGPKKLAALERELKVAEMTGGRSAVRSRYGKDGKLILEDTPIKNSQGESGIDVFGKNGELIQVGGPGKNANPGVLVRTKKALQVLKEEARVRKTKAQVYLEQGDSVRFNELVTESKKILGDENVFIFAR